MFTLEQVDEIKKVWANDMLSDIGMALEYIIKDIESSYDDEMDLELGEIYRQKLKDITRILRKKGVKYI